MLLSKENIDKADDRKTIDVEVPEWGGTVRVATMSATARDSWEYSMSDTKGKLNPVNIRAKLVAACLVDINGELLFKEKDIPGLGKKSAKALDRIFAKAQKLNGIGDAEVEDLAKN